MSQSVRSHPISESTIARIAGNLLSGMDRHLPSDDDAVRWAVKIARAIAAEVQRTQQEQP